MNRNHMFDDPFFTDPFGMMRNMMGNGPFNDPFFQSGGFGMGQGMSGRQQQQPQQNMRPNVRIQEVEDEDEEYQTDNKRGEEPLVEEPDDEPGVRYNSPSRSRSYQPQQPQQPQQAYRSASMPDHQNPGFRGQHPYQRQQRQQPMMDPMQSMMQMMGMNFPAFPSISAMGGGGGGASYCYSSSSYSSTGPNGVTVQRTQTTRVGPNGVRETQATLRDGRTGEQKITIARGLGDRERVMTRVRDGTGRERAEDVLKGISHHEAEHFDNEWQNHARQALPGGLGGLHGARQHQPVQPQLQYHQGSSGSGSGSRREGNYGSQRYDRGY